jgi:DNA mismatch repair protein MutL
LAEQGPTRGPQNVFVNRRIVKDRTIAHAIIDSYSVASIKERSPEVHLFIEMPFDALDVNVHPTKAEVRFRDQSFMHEVIRRTLGDALGRGPAPSWSAGTAARRSAADDAAAAGELRTTFPSRWTVRASAPACQATKCDRTRRHIAPDNDAAIEPFAPRTGAVHAIRR